ncbi:DNA translocase FtsK [Salinicoccus sp. ID82-1]|uniref:DNA translocase FtsK n=1 Tax=Salinicoccus cyprini TaxID=2493691 RepID=A0A558AZP2_9STAP|nr:MULTISPECIES: DNA translocase FtsK [Salinicoccus]MCG1009377.1 DNA translocase FtsK [Salinicoccus sp. ID82-1]TVT29749.1 DNA translocase FtsK [Salinicoccus cyprini]
MNRSRRRRQFGRSMDENHSDKERFRFPLDMDDSAQDAALSQQEDRTSEQKSHDDPIRREQQKSLLDDSRYQRRRPKKNTIIKAREVPSAIHGSKGNPGSKKNDQQDASADSEKSGYVSPIVEELKRERQNREKRQQKRLEHNGKKMQIHPTHLEPSPAEETQPDVSDQDEDIREAQQSASPFNVIMTPYDKNKHRSSQNTVKRSGPKSTLPPLHILGEGQNSAYETSGESFADEVVAAFDAIGVPTKVIAYKTNGIIGRYELSLERNFRLNVIGKLKEHLVEVLPFDDVKIVAPIVGTSNIGVEFVLPVIHPIPFSTLFASSSLSTRKNDYKFVVGKTVDDQIFSFPLQKAGHILIYGGEAVDSTSVIDNILVSLMMNHGPRELEIMVASDKESHRAYGSLPYAFREPVSLTEKHVLTDALEELNDRHNQFRRAHVRNLDSYNKRVRNDAKKSVVVIVIDDLSELFEHNNPEAIRSIVQLLKKGKPLGMHLIMNHSRKDVGIRFELLQMMHTRISFKDEKSRVVDGSNELVRGNDMLIQIPTSNKPLRVNAGILDQKIKENVLSYLKGMTR